MLIRLQKYDYELSYQPGAQMYIADTLSRAYIEGGKNSDADFEVISIMNCSSIPADKLTNIREATREDPVMKELTQMLVCGWPENKREVPQQLRIFYKDRYQFAMEQGLILKGDRLLIPRGLRKELIKEIHVAHSGVNGCIRRARELFYWPGMTSEIRDHVTQCELCRRHDRIQSKEPMILRELPSRPWQMIAVDLFAHAGKQYLVMVDYYSDYFEIEQLATVSAAAIINRMRSQFSRHGIPELLFSDNGPQFTSEEFQRFGQKWGFEHRTSSPYYSQSNGKAESAVKVAKHIMKLARESGEDPYLMLLEQRNIPTAVVGYSPAQRMFSRRTRTKVPSVSSALQPKPLDSTSVATRLQERREAQKRYYDRGAHQLPELKEGEKVWVQCVPENPKLWVKGEIKKNCGFHSYEVEVDGVLRRRNRRHLRKAHGTKANTIMNTACTKSGQLFQNGKDVGLPDHTARRKASAVDWSSLQPANDRVNCGNRQLANQQEPPQRTLETKTKPRSSNQKRSYVLADAAVKTNGQLQPNNYQSNQTKGQPIK
jgi:predicted Fe-S protein YdhL (DUF1289 family)